MAQPSSTSARAARSEDAATTDGTADAVTANAAAADAATADAASPPPDIAALSFEQALGELETIVRALEQGDVDLDQAVTAYERGVALKRHCESRLKDARMKVERIQAGPEGAGGAVSVQPFDTAG